jgi:hypothetical protein
MNNDENITLEQFNQKIAEQQAKLKILKWRDLTVGKIYKIINVEYITTAYGEACIIELDDAGRVFAPSGLAKRLNEDETPFPRHVRPTGLKKSRKNETQHYFSFDLL